MGGRNALLQRPHVGGKRRLVTHRRRNAAEQCRDFRARLRKAEDIVDEEQHILPLVAEIFGHGEAGEPDACARAWRLVHLTVDQCAFRAGGRALVLFRVLVDARLDHFMVQIITLASALADAGEYRIAAVSLGDIVDQLHDGDGLADAGAAEQTDLAAPGIRRQQVDDFDAGDEDLRLGRLFGIGRGRLVNGAPFLVHNGSCFIHGLADHVDDASERAVPDRHRNRLAGVGHRLAAHQPFAGVHRDGAHRRLSEVLSDLEHQPVAVIVGLERVQDCRQLAVELHVDDRADDLGDASRLVGHKVSSLTYKSTPPRRRR